MIPLLVTGQNLAGLQESPYTSATHEKIHYGVRAGVNLTTSQFGHGTRESLQPLHSTGWTVGALAAYRFNHRFGLKAELGYTKKVNRFQDDSLGYENKLNLHLADFSLIVQCRYPVNIGELQSDFYFGAGPNVSYWMGSDGSLTTTAGTFDYPVVLSGEQAASMETLYLTGTNRWLLGLDVAAGIMMPVNRTHRLLVELRASMGFTTLGETWSTVYLEGLTSPDPAFLTQRLNSLTLSATYAFSYNLMESKFGRSTKEKEVKKRDPRKQKKDKSYLDTRIKK